MTRWKSCNNLLETKYQQFEQASNRKRNLCVEMVQKAKKRYCNNLNIRNIADNKQFRKTVKPFFPSKIDSNERITLTEEGEVASEDNEMAETFTSYFEAL